MQDPWRKRKQPRQGSPARRRCLVEQPQARPTVFHETRDTNHGLYRRPVAAFLRVVVRLWRGLGGRRLPRRQYGPCGRSVRRGWARGRHKNPSPDLRVIRIVTASLPAISHDFPPFPGISHDFPAPPPPWERVRAPFSRCFTARCGAAWAAAVPRAGNTACKVFTSHETRNMGFPYSSGDSRENSPKPGQQVFHESRDTSHESRPLFACFDRRVVRNAG